MSLIQQYLGLALFTSLYIVGFGTYFISMGNREFLWYVLVMVLLVVLVGATLRQSRIPRHLLWLLSFWGLLHMAGGGVRIDDHVLYAHVLYPFMVNGEFTVLKYDQVVHAYGFGVSALVLYQLLSQRINGALSRFWFSVVILLAAMGLGVVNEIVEFIAVLAGPSGVGGYYNTLLDLVFNTLGALIALVFLHISRRYRERLE